MLLRAAYLLAIAQAAILGIDYGHQWTKAGLVKPGIPMEMVITMASRRKEQSVIGFKKNERSYGEDAIALSGRFPQETFPELKLLLGQRRDSQAVKDYLARFPAVKLAPGTDNNVVAFERFKTTALVEELVANQIANMVYNARIMAGEEIDGVVLTVPPFFTERQRGALIEAARLANVKVMSLISDGVAVAIDYAKARHFDEPQIHVVFDSGAGSTSATVVKFETKLVKDFGRFKKNVTSIEVLGTAFDKTLGGQAMTDVLFEHFATEFDSTEQKQLEREMRKNPRALSRLLRESNKIKQVLSANTEATLSVESLHENVDFRRKISRVQFEELTQGMAPRVSAVLKNAFAAASIDASNITSLILHGGATRVPFVQRALLDVVSEEQLSRNVNADESATIGAVFRGAGLSGRFKVKDVRVQDRSIFPVEGAFTHDGQGNFEELFPNGTPFESALNLTLPSSLTNNLQYTVRYGAYPALPIASDDVEGKARHIGEFDIIGMQDAISSLKKEYACSPAAFVSAKLDSSGMVKLDDPFVWCEVDDSTTKDKTEDSGVAGKLKGWFGGDSSSEDGDTKQKVAKKPVTTGKTKPQKMRIEKQALLVYEKPGPGARLNETFFDAAFARIQKLDQMDDDRIQGETARNELESYIYQTRETLNKESWLSAAKPEEAERLRVAAKEAAEWLVNEGDDAKIAAFKEHRKKLVDLSMVVDMRTMEHDVRDDMVSQLEKLFDVSQRFVNDMKANATKYQAEKAAWDAGKPERQAARAAAREERKRARLAEAAARAEKAQAEAELDGLDDEDAAAKASATPAQVADDAAAVEEDEIEEDFDDEADAPVPPAFKSEDELDELDDLLTETQTWLTKAQKKQASMKRSDEVHLTTRSIMDAQGKLEKLFTEMRGKYVYYQPPKPKAKPAKGKSNAKSKSKDKASKAQTSASSPTETPVEGEKEDPQVEIEKEDL
ncbi:lumenal Hsp70 protein [Savitreella phatthalungensis]